MNLSFPTESELNHFKEECRLSGKRYSDFLIIFHGYCLGKIAIFISSTVYGPYYPSQFTPLPESEQGKDKLRRMNFSEKQEKELASQIQQFIHLFTRISLEPYDTETELGRKHHYLMYFLNQTYSYVSEAQFFCLPSICSKFKSYTEKIFLCSGHSKPQECCAIDCMMDTLDFALSDINDKLSKVNSLSPKTVENWCRRTVRIFEHLHSHHFLQFLQLEFSFLLSARFEEFCKCIGLSSFETLDQKAKEIERNSDSNTNSFSRESKVKETVSAPVRKFDHLFKTVSELRYNYRNINTETFNPKVSPFLEWQTENYLYLLFEPLDKIFISKNVT